MFRMGGTAEGITSGLQPRQGYKERPGRVLPEDLARMKMSDIGGMDLGQLQKLSRSMSYKPQRKYGPDFWVDFGLNLASTPPAGNILSTAALAAKDPFSRYTGAKKEDELSQYASESDMFTTMLGAQADVLAAERGEGMAGKTEQWKFEQVPKLINTISELESIPVDERTTEQQNDLDTAKINLGRLEKEDPFVGWFLDSDQSEKLFKKTKTDLLEADQQSDEPVYTGEDDPQLWEDTYVEFRKRVKRMGKAEGGRAGYQDAGTVMPGQPMQAAQITDQAAMPTDQGPSPKDMGAITYEELRARLPQEVSDDIVRLLANSAEALEDFAMIQTEQDINTFNKKYGVNLVLPSEG